MKRKKAYMVMAGILAVGMTLSGCGKNSGPAAETTQAGVESSADAGETTTVVEASTTMEATTVVEATTVAEATTAKEPETTEVAPTTPPATDPTTAPDPWYSDRFRSLGDPTFSMPEGANPDESAAEGTFKCSNVSKEDYDTFLLNIKADGFLWIHLNSMDFMFRDDCMIFSEYYHVGTENIGTFSFYWYRESPYAPENGMSPEEAAELLMPNREKSPSESMLHPIDVTPEGFYERTGGQLFAVPEFTGYTWCNSFLYYVNGSKAFNSSKERVAIADVNGDGKDEVLLLSNGPTSGVYSVLLKCITEQESFDTILVGMEYNFRYDEDGRLCIGNDKYVDISEVIGEKRVWIDDGVVKKYNN
ncbi:MAG: hypothetical protein J5757_06330 [Lachnospiraceae bacterium]|nr:hypothetical protein [Lachnospiraceae bacterium]